LADNMARKAAATAFAMLPFPCRRGFHEPDRPLIMPVKTGGGFAKFCWNFSVLDTQQTSVELGQLAQSHYITRKQADVVGHQPRRSAKWMLSYAAG